MRFCIVQRWAAYRNCLAAVLLGAVSAAAMAQPGDGAAPAADAAQASAPAAAGSVAATERPRQSWAAMTRAAGRLRSGDIGLVINTADPYSVAVGEYYIEARRLLPDQVLRVQLPVQQFISRADFDRLRAQIDAHFGQRAQALALAWNQPYMFHCNAITGALALGFDEALCAKSCGPSRQSLYFSQASARPLSDFGFRLSMLLASRTVEQAKEMIDRGVASDGSLLKRNRPVANALLLTTNDGARRVRQILYPPDGLLPSIGVAVQIRPENVLPGAVKVLFAITGSERPPLTPAPEWLPGGLGDHLTSTGGDLFGPHGQGTVLDWLASGATASHGSVSEPCNHLQKFPHPQVLMGQYMQGVTAIEAYWKSVAWPQQSLFVGEPLAAPFSTPSIPLR